MQLWKVAILFVFLAIGTIIAFLLVRRRDKKQWTVAAFAVASVILLALAVYVLLTLILVYATGNAPPDGLPESTSDVNPEAIVPITPLILTPDAQLSGTPTSMAPIPSMPTPMPEDYDLPVSEVPMLYPDVLGLRSLKYEEMPTFGTQNEVTGYVLYNFVNNQFQCEFYITKDIAVDVGTGHIILDQACETAMTYYLFSAYYHYDMYTEDRGDDNKFYAKIKLIYTDPDFDLEAKAEALEFVMKNPIPIGGFQDFDSEKAYARKIHDFIGTKITYSPIGYDPESMSGMEKYEALQEAYNVLAEDENTAVCAAYARAFALIAQYAGINTAWVLGNETEIESHAWNIIYPCDGSEPVLVDVTWDDGYSDDEPGQTDVSDVYFYIPLHEETEHLAVEHFDEFLSFINKK